MHEQQEYAAVSLFLLEFPELAQPLSVKRAVNLVAEMFRYLLVSITTHSDLLCLHLTSGVLTLGSTLSELHFFRCVWNRASFDGLNLQTYLVAQPTFMALRARQRAPFSSGGGV